MNQIGNIVPDFMNDYFSKVTRVETINHAKCKSCNGAGKIVISGQPDTFECPDCHGLGVGGRDVIMLDVTKQVRLELQDNGRTLKVFIKDREQ
jgi:DnaJ-class molecular chaperone